MEASDKDTRFRELVGVRYGYGDLQWPSFLGTAIKCRDWRQYCRGATSMRLLRVLAIDMNVFSSTQGTIIVSSFSADTVFIFGWYYCLLVAATRGQVRCRWIAMLAVAASSITLETKTYNLQTQYCRRIFVLHYLRLCCLGSRVKWWSEVGHQILLAVSAILWKRYRYFRVSYFTASIPKGMLCATDDYDLKARRMPSE